MMMVRCGVMSSNDVFGASDVNDVFGEIWCDVVE